jgi:hypothetical protein
VKFEISIPDSLAIPEAEMHHFRLFLQRMANRRAQGSARYGRISKSQRYMSRLITEAQVYKKSGNQEQLLNIAVYCFLESYAPENKKAFFDPAAESVTRKRYGAGVGK